MPTTCTPSWASGIVIAAGAAPEFQHRPLTTPVIRSQNGTSRRPSVRAFSQS